MDGAAITMLMSEGQSFVRATLGVKGRRVILVLLLAAALTGCSDRASRAHAEGQRAEALLQQGDLPGAREAIGRALALRDNDIGLLLLDARIKFTMQDILAAYDAYAFILALEPNHPEALLGVAQFGMSTGNLRESLDAIERILARDPGQPDALLLKGVHAINRNDYEEALAAGEKLIESAPGDPRGVVLKARASFLLGRRDEAFFLLRDATIRLGNNEMIATGLLENARDQADHVVMLEQLSLLRQNRPASIDLAIDEANIRYKSGDLSGARRVGSEMLARFGEDAGAMRRLADLWLEYDPDPLDGSERQALAERGALNARLTVARHYFRSGEFTAASALLRSGGDDRMAALNARIGLASGNSSAATEAAAIARRDTTNCDALAAMAEAALGRGDEEAAITSAQVVGAECLDNSDGFVLLARAYAAQNRPAGVERAYREGISAHPLDRLLTERFAEWLLAQDRPQPAISTARRLTQRAPAKASSWRLLASVCQRAGNAACVREAEAQEVLAKRNFVLDIPPGERPANPLFGQIWR